MGTQEGRTRRPAGRILRNPHRCHSPEVKAIQHESGPDGRRKKRRRTCFAQLGASEERLEFLREFLGCRSAASPRFCHQGRLN